MISLPFFVVEKLNLIKKEIEEIGKEDIRDKKELKVKIAQFFKELVSLAEEGKLKREEAAYIIASFFRVEFGDELEEIVSLAADLEIGPGINLDEKEFNSTWDYLSKTLSKYLTSR